MNPMNPSRNEVQRTFSAVAGVRGAPCSANRMWKRAKQGHLYLSDAASAWEMAVATDVRTQMDTHRLKRWWIEAGQPKLRVSVTFYGVRGDIDNYLKTTLDGLKHALGIDDKFYSPVEAHLGERLRADGRTRQPQGARIEVTGESAAPAPPPSEPEPEPEPEPDDDLLAAASQQQIVVATDEPAATATAEAGAEARAEAGWRVADLVDDALVAQPLAQMREPLRHVMVWPANRYGSIVVLFPQSAQNGTAEWSTFLPLDQARELRDLLNGLPHWQEVRL